MQTRILLLLAILLFVGAAQAKARQAVTTLPRSSSSFVVTDSTILAGPRLYRFSGQSWYLDHEFSNYSVHARARLGWAVGLTDSLVVLGAPEEGTMGVHAGAAVVFEREGATWHERSILHASDAVGGRYFGGAVAVAGSTIVVGAAANAAYLFEWDGQDWGETAKLVPDEPGDSRFGWDVAVEGEWLVVSAPSIDAIGAPPGSVYIYRRVAGQWSFHSKLHMGVHGGFGHSMALSGDKLAIAFQSVWGESGTVHVFHYNASSDRWQRETSLNAPFGNPARGFGWKVELAGTVLAVAAVGSVDHSVPASVYLFDLTEDGWAYRARVTPSDGRFNNRYAMGMSTSLLAVAGYWGVTYVYQLSAISTESHSRDLVPTGLGLDVFPSVTPVSLRLKISVGDCQGGALVFYDILGRQARDVSHVLQVPGPTEVLTDVSDLAVGPYFARLRCGPQVVIRPFTVAR